MSSDEVYPKPHFVEETEEGWLKNGNFQTREALCKRVKILVKLPDKKSEQLSYQYRDRVGQWVEAVEVHIFGQENKIKLVNGARMKQKKLSTFPPVYLFNEDKTGEVYVTQNWDRTWSSEEKKLVTLPQQSEVFHLIYAEQVIDQNSEIPKTDEKC